MNEIGNYNKILKRREGCGLFDNIILHLVHRKNINIDWLLLPENPNVTFEFIQRNLDSHIEIDRHLSLNPNLTLEFIEKHFCDFDTEDDNIFMNPSLNLATNEACQFIEKHYQKINWRRISRNPTITLDFIKKYEENIFDYHAIWGNDAFDFSKLETLDYFENHLIHNFIIEWAMVSYNPTLTFKFIKKYQHKIDFSNLFYHLKLDFSKKKTRKFLKKYKDQWYDLSNNPYLSIGFIEENLNQLNQVYLSSNPALTIDYIECNLGRVHFYQLLNNPSITLEFIEKYLLEYINKIEENEFWINPLNLHPVVLARNKKAYSAQLLKELTEYFENKEISYNKNIFDLCMHEINMIARDIQNKTNKNKIKFI